MGSLGRGRFPICNCTAGLPRMVITSWNSQQQSMSCSLVVVVGQGSSRSSKRREIPDHHRRNVANHLLQTAASSVQQLLDFERQGHLCARAFFNPQELSSLEACVTEAAESQKLNAYRHRVAVLCPGVDPFSVKTIQEAQNIIRLKVLLLLLSLSLFSTIFSFWVRPDPLSIMDCVLLEIICF